MTSRVKRTHAEWDRAWWEKDAATAERIMATDFRYIGPHGHSLGREDLLRVIRDPTYKLRSGGSSDLSVRPVGDLAAVLHDRWRGGGEYAGQEFVDDHARTFVYERRGEDWCLVIEHCSAYV